MIQELEHITRDASWDTMRQRLGEYLGIGEVPASVLNRAISDDKFAFYLLSCRNQPAFLQALIDDKNTAGYEPVQQAHEHSTVQLASRATKAMIRWSKSGFTRVEPEVYEQRFNACLQCPHLVEPPDKMIYKMVGGRMQDNRVCGACGCNAARKARIPTEQCPVADPGNPAVNRWGQRAEVEAG